MRYENWIGDVQKDFIRKLRDGDLTPERWKEIWEEDRKGVSRWFRNKYFWWEVQRAVKHLMRMSQLETKLLAVKVDGKLREAMKDGGEGVPEDVRETFEMIKANSRADDRLELALRRGRRRRKKKAEAERDLVHPDFKHREGELLAMLDRDGC